MKKTIISGLSLLALLFTSGCNINGSINDKVLNVKGTSDETVKELARQTALGFSSLNQQTSLKKSRNSFTDEEIENIKEALDQVEVFLNENNTVKVDTVDSNKQEYANRLDVSFLDEDISLYYNDINTNEKYEERDEKETTVSFKGIALYNNEEFEFTFISEEEAERNEVEKESTLTIFKDSNSYIKVSQSTEEEVNESGIGYSYLEVVNGNVIVDYEISIETENNKKKVDLELNDVEYEIKYYYINEKQLIKVELENGNDKEKVGMFEKVIINNADGTTSTTYKLFQ